MAQVVPGRVRRPRREGRRRLPGTTRSRPQGGSVRRSWPLRSQRRESAVAAVLLVAVELALRGLAALLDGVALLAGAESALAGQGLGALGILLLLSHVHPPQ